jgi:hypothetical protein
MKGFFITLLIFWVISRFLKKNVYINTFNTFNQQPPPQRKEAPRRPEGELTIEKIKPTSSKKNKKDDDDGEFVPYIEVK